MTMEYVRPAAPVAPWMGGKSKLAKTLIERIERIPHKTYVEPFVGMGGVFLRRGFRPRLEVANDLNGEIINLFRILQRLAFGGQVTGVFGVAPTHAPRFSLSRLEPILDAAHERLEGVVFECLDWSDLIRRYDSPETLFYLDPPYHGGETDYGKGMFERDDFARMAALLGEIKGSFVLSINDTQEIRDTFAAFVFDEVQLTYTVGREAPSGKVGELIISNGKVVPGLL